MSEHQGRIAQILRESLRDVGRHLGRDVEQKLARDLHAALHPVVETVDQLDALPEGAVIHVPHKVTASSVEKRHNRWWPNRSTGPFHHGFRDELLPARVLYTPEVDR